MMKVRITGRQPEMRKELDEEVDQMEFFVEVAKGELVSGQGEERRGGYFDLTFSVTVMPGDPGTMGAEKE